MTGRAMSPERPPPPPGCAASPQHQPGALDTGLGLRESQLCPKLSGFSEATISEPVTTEMTLVHLIPRVAQ